MASTTIFNQPSQCSLVAYPLTPINLAGNLLISLPPSFSKKNNNFEFKLNQNQRKRPFILTGMVGGFNLNPMG
jgi:hypothetical protein